MSVTYPDTRGTTETVNPLTLAWSEYGMTRSAQR